MQNLILCKSFYNDINQLSELISSLEYTDCLYGQHIEDFQYVPQPLSGMFSELLHQPIEIQPDTGTFIKPNSMVHFDNFYEHALWSCVVALEDTTITLHKHESGITSFFDVPEDMNRDQFFIDNCMNKEKWTPTSVINMEKNDFVFVRPWLWKSFEEGKLIQKFMLNHMIKEES